MTFEDKRLALRALLRTALNDLEAVATDENLTDTGAVELKEAFGKVGECINRLAMLNILEQSP